MHRLVKGLLLAIATWGGSSHAVNCCNVVVEYHNTLLDHYFMAILPNEIASVDEGKAGPGWTRTGETFLTEDYGLFTAGRPLLRFYGSNDIGPNSHFYTNIPSEYQMLQRIEAETPPGVRKWHYETAGFPAGLMDSTGIGCEAPRVYKVPIHRLYNNGVARGIDPNHRYTKRQQVVDEMVAKGWVFEGPVFCVIQ